MNLVTQIVPRAKFDNDLLAYTLTLPPNAQLGTDQPSTVYRARLQGTPSMVILEAVAPDGYSGKIRIIVGVVQLLSLCPLLAVSNSVANAVKPLLW